MLHEVSIKDILLPGLYVTEPADLPFMDGVEVRSYLIRTGDTFVAIYNSPGLSLDGNAIRGSGTPSALLMSHWHEAIYKAPRLDIAAYVGTADLARTRASMPNVNDLSHRLGGDGSIKIVSTPGHTTGFSMFLWTSGDHRVLFSGDMIWSHDGRWEAVVLDESDRLRYISSLKAIAELDFDVMVPWVSQRGTPCVITSDKGAARAMVLEIAGRIENGESA